MKLNDLVSQAYSTAKEHGFWDMENSIIQKMQDDKNYTLEEVNAVQRAFRVQRIALIITELAEAIEAIRHDNIENFQEEMGDTLIQLGDNFGGDNLLRGSIEEAIKKKMQYNKTRPYMHGKKF
jgi:NTP pyrophosphatase (non-canonical NTP hydrolase)